MDSLLAIAAVAVLATVAGGLIRVLRGPEAADRIAAAQLLGTGGIAALLLWGAAEDTPALLDAALTLAVLAPFASVAMARGAPPDEDGDARG
jgi:multicomponent Na+:H+ antiporter subunit F